MMDESFFRDLVARSRDAIITIDAESTVLFANDGVKEVLGYEPSELEGEPLTTVMPERFQERHHEAVARYLATEERTMEWNDIELPAEHADGHEVPLSITFEEHEHDDERLFSGIMRDVTYRVEREQRLERQNEQLERFAGYVSHDLRDPLNTARTTIALMRAAEDDTDREQYVSDLEELLGRMESLIEDVLTLAQGGRVVGEPEPVPLETVVNDAWRTTGDDAATLEVTGATTIDADRERLLALLENLLGNAVQHGSSGSGSSTHVEVGVTDDGFYVADDGPGIPDADREQVFERGYTTAEAGSGLGLDIVRTIAGAHDWTVEATQSDAGGARIDVRTD